MADASAESAAKRSKRNYKDTIVVWVGSEESKRDFIVHKEAICSKSQYFQAACSTRWSEGQDKVIRLPDMDPEVFETVLHWMYTAELDVAILSESCEPPAKHQPCYLNLAIIWAAANYLGNANLRNLIVDRLVAKWEADRAHVNTRSVNVIWHITPVDSKIRQLFIDIQLCGIGRHSWDGDGEHLPNDLIREAAKMFFRDEQQSMKSGPTWKQRCQYHEHEEGEPKCT